MRSLNLACGKDIRPGFVNMDVAALPGVDVIHDALSFPWPFEAASFDRVFASHYFEHVPHWTGTAYGRVATMREIHRVLKPGGTLTVLTPHWRYTPHVLGDPTHAAPWHPRAWSHFDPAAVDAPTWYAPTAPFRLESWRVSRRAARAPGFLKVRGLGVFDHVKDRLGPLAWPVTRPAEVTYTLRALRVGDPGRGSKPQTLK